YPIIKTLMDETFKVKDQQLKVLLASMEYKARKCKECIKGRRFRRSKENAKRLYKMFTFFEYFLSR
ncbi:MAG: hypothetical protein NTX52_12940, partial [Planctomycetota bacterium]|nr:hypothetical protein [Planctomycetota bacterium]